LKGGFDKSDNTFDAPAQRQGPNRRGGTGPGDGLCEKSRKTDGGDLVTAYQCNPFIADQEFLFSKRQYAVITGRTMM